MDVVLFRRRAGVNPKLIIALVVCVIGFGVFWFLKSGPDKEAYEDVDLGKTYSLVCSQCKAVSQVKANDVSGLKLQKGYYQCPSCKAWSASFNSPDSAAAKEKPKSDKPEAIMP